MTRHFARYPEWTMLGQGIRKLGFDEISSTSRFTCPGSCGRVSVTRQPEARKRTADEHERCWFVFTVTPGSIRWRDGKCSFVRHPEYLGDEAGL
jgi:predicted RNA-binding Zn-ribbon protein involved in translation (DUF1610 family)